MSDESEITVLWRPVMQAELELIDAAITGPIQVVAEFRGEAA